jgi:hypothetical protein
MAKKPSPKPNEPDKEQAARFIETARLLEVDESGADFERAAAIVVRKRPKDTQSLTVAPVPPRISKE